MMCGTPLGGDAARAQMPRPHADPETLRFLRAVISRPATFTFIFLIANVFLYVLMWLSGNSTDAVLTAYGAKLNSRINEGELWRFVTPIFLHVQLPRRLVEPGVLGALLANMHLLSNMYGLFMLGPYVEKLYGSARFVVFWIVSGIAGVVASYLAVQPRWAHGVGEFIFKPYDAPSAGASGALFGLMGVLFVFGIKYRHELPDGLQRAFGTGLLPTLFINLFIGYVAREFIDNAAHLGGLFAGMGLALAVGYKRPGPRGPVARAWHVAQAACLLLVAVCFLLVAVRFEAPPRPSNVTEGVMDRSAVRPFIEAVNAGQGALTNFLNGNPEWLAAAAESLEKSPAPTTRAGALREDLKALVARAGDAAADKSLQQPGQQSEREGRMRQLDAGLQEWQERFSQWVKTEGEELGVSMQNSGEPASEKR
jgi:membrane associated rhomboid family serine protease